MSNNHSRTILIKSVHIPVALVLLSKFVSISKTLKPYIVYTGMRLVSVEWVETEIICSTRMKLASVEWGWDLDHF